MDGANTNTSGWGTGKIENTRKKPNIVGSIGDGLIGNTIDVFVSGDFAYVTNQDEGLKVVNITDPSNPFIIGSYDTPDLAQSVFISGDYAYIADYQGDIDGFNFQIANISDPTNPSYVGKAETYDEARNVYVSGNYAYVANGYDGLCILDITNPTNPTIVGTCDTSGYALDDKVVGNFVYLADDINGLVVINVSNPLVPAIVAEYNTSISSAISVVVEGNYAYVADFDNGIVVVNITDPTAPSFAGSWSKSGVSDAYIGGDYLYITDINDGLSVVNIADPTAPIFIQAISLLGFSQAIVINGHYAYLACFDGGLQIVQIADIYPSYAGSYDTPDRAMDVFISDGFAYVADAESGLQIINISNPTSPSFAGSYNTPDTALNVFVSGSFAYVADYYSGLQILDISDPSTPTLASTYDTPGRAKDVFVSGDYAYIADYLGDLQIININNPTSPTFAGSTDILGHNNGVYVSGGFAYVAAGSLGLLIINVTNPSSPTLAGSYVTPYAGCVFVSGSYAYVGCQVNGFLQILNITDPSSPTLASSYDTPFAVTDVFVSGGFAYVAEAHLGLQVINVTNPSSPTLTFSYDTPNNAGSVLVSGDYAYVADTTGLLVLKFSSYRSRQFVSPCVTQSDNVFSSSSSTITSATLVANDNTPFHTSITYSLSADGGINWETITPGIEHVFTNTGTQLKWKAVLTTSDFLVTPSINNLSIDYTTTLVAPSLSTPIDGYTTEDYTPTFTWTGINGESSYLFQLDTTTSFTAPLLNLTLSSISSSYTPSSELAPNTYYWRVAGIDPVGDIGFFSDYRSLTIIDDTVNPIIDHPVDVTYEKGQTGNEITWNPSDSNPDRYTIRVDGVTKISNVNWNGGSISYNIDGYSVGTYYVRCIVYDTENNNAYDEVQVDVDPSSVLIIDDIENFEYEEGSTGNNITWHPSVINPDWYIITRNTIVIEEGDWDGGDLSIDIDGLSYGIYIYACTVNDTDGNEISDFVTVTVTDTVNPNINSPANINYNEGIIGYNIIWVATDNNPSTYTVYKDGVLYETDTWVSGSSIIISVDGLSAGQYNFTIVVYDFAGNLAKNEVTVAVTPTVPEFNQSIIFAILSITVVFVIYQIKRKNHKKS